MIIVKILICLAVPTRTAIVIVEIFTSVLISTIIMSWEEFFFKSLMNRNFNKPMGILLIESFVEW